MSLPEVFRSLVVALGLGLFTSVALANSYEAKLPPELSTSPKMCDYAPCADVIPGADSFSERKGQPSYVEAVTYVNLLLRERALGHDDEAAKKADVAEADKWHKRAQQMLAAQSSASARAADDDKKKKVGH